MAQKIVYVLTKNPKEKSEIVSSVFAQALTSLSFGYETEIFLMDAAVEIARKGVLDGVKAPTFEPIAEMLSNYLEMEGILYICHPSSDAREIKESDCIEGIAKFVNASKLLESSIQADALFTY